MLFEENYIFFLIKTPGQKVYKFGKKYDLYLYYIYIYI